MQTAESERYHLAEISLTQRNGEKVDINFTEPAN